MLDFLRRWWIPLLAGTLLGGSGAFFFSTQAPPRYVSTSTLLVYLQTTPGEVTGADLQTSSGLAAVLSTLALLDGVAEEAVELGDLPISADELRGATSVEARPGYPLIQVQAVSDDSQLAQQMANALAEAIISINEADRRVAPGAVTIVQSAGPGFRSSDRRQNATLGAALGFVSALGIAFAVETAGRIRGSRRSREAS